MCVCVSVCAGAVCVCGVFACLCENESAKRGSTHHLFERGFCCLLFPCSNLFASALLVIIGAYSILHTVYSASLVRNFGSNHPINGLR